MENSQSPLDVRVSFFKDAYQTNKPIEITIRQFLENVRTGKYSKQVKAARAVKHDPTAYYEKKKLVPGISLSALLSTREKEVELKDKLISHSNVIQTDVDKVQDLPAFRQQVDSDPHTLFSYVSMGGDGLKVGVRIDGARHEDSFRSVERYFREKFGVPIDSSVKEVVRLCFASHDPDVFINENAEVLPIIEIKPEAPNPSTPIENNGNHPIGQRALRLAEKLIEDSADGEKHHVLLKAARLLGGYVAGGLLDIEDARLTLQAAIRMKPNVACLKTADATISDGLKHGQQAPIFCEFDRFEEPKSRNRSATSNEDDHEPEILQWPILSEDALHGLAGDFVRLATRNSEADPAAVLVTFLVRFCAEVGSRPRLMVGDSTHYARLFAAIVGATSKARKGTSHSPVARCYEGLSSLCSLTSPKGFYFCARSTPGPLSSGEGLIHAVRDLIEKPVVDKKTGEVTIQTVDPGVTDKRLFVCDEELGGALSCTKREGNTLSTNLRCAWDHGNMDPLTKTSKISARGAHITVVGHITRAELRQKLDDVEGFNGFANRFLWVCARRNGIVPFPEPMEYQQLINIQKQLFDSIREVQLINEMTLSLDARRLWVEVYPVISEDHDGLPGAVINRAEAQVLRLSMVYALLDSSATIEDDHLKAALAMWDYCKCSAEYIFHGFESDPISDKILKKVQAEKQVEWTDLYTLFANHVSKISIDTAVNELLRKDKVKLDTIKTPGRPKRILLLQDQSPKSEKDTHTSEESEVSEKNPDQTLRDYLNGLQIGLNGAPEVKAACLAAGYIDDRNRLTETGWDFLWCKDQGGVVR